MARVQQYLVSVTVPDEDERFYAVNGSDEWTGNIQEALDSLGDDITDDNFDDRGRMSVFFDVQRLPDLPV